MPAPTLTQIARAKADHGLRARVMLAAEIANHSQGEVELAYARILAAPVGDSNLAYAYEFHWVTVLGDIAASAGTLDRTGLSAALDRIGTDPARITDAQISEAVANVLV